jgi:hypothetical protein
MFMGYHPSQSVKARHGGSYLSSQLLKKPKEQDQDPGWPGRNMGNYLKIAKAKRTGVYSNSRASA